MASEGIEHTDDDGITIRSARTEDGRRMWQLVHDSEALELNTGYAYLAVCAHFGPTSIIAEHQGRPVGFIAGYIPETRPDAVFVWQIGVDGSMRGRGLGTRMLQTLTAAPACRRIRYLETTVTPSNTASRRMFARFAEKMGAECEVQRFFDAELFPEEGHEPEDMFRIGPFD